jgi:hypothetical protein
VVASPPMGLVRVIAAVVAAGLLVAAAPAGAATIRADHRCYTEGDPIRITGSGFTPRTPVAFRFDGNPFGAPMADADGRIRARSEVPRVKTRFRTVKITASDGQDTSRRAETTVTVTKLLVTISPISGPPDRTVTFRARGFPRARSLYVHYVNPRRKVVKTVRLGRTARPCGTTEARAQLIPFAKPSAGTWSLRFDTRQDYSGTTRPQVRLPVTVKGS